MRRQLLLIGFSVITIYFLQHPLPSKEFHFPCGRSTSLKGPHRAYQVQLILDTNGLGSISSPSGISYKHSHWASVISSRIAVVYSHSLSRYSTCRTTQKSLWVYSGHTGSV